MHVRNVFRYQTHSSMYETFWLDFLPLFVCCLDEAVCAHFALDGARSRFLNALKTGL